MTKITYPKNEDAVIGENQHKYSATTNAIEEQRSVQEYVEKISSIRSLMSKISKNQHKNQRYR